jgi:hypothetical protein
LSHLCEAHRNFARKSKPSFTTTRTRFGTGSGEAIMLILDLNARATGAIQRIRIDGLSNATG